jgi:hypothetical protein
LKALDEAVGQEVADPKAENEADPKAENEADYDVGGEEKENEEEHEWKELRGDIKRDAEKPTREIGHLRGRKRRRRSRSEGDDLTCLHSTTTKAKRRGNQPLQLNTFIA